MGQCYQPCMFSVPTMPVAQFFCPKTITAVGKQNLGWPVSVRDVSC